MRPDAGAPPAADWERDWRGDVMRQLRESSEAHQQAAVILERLSNRLDEHDRRIKSLEDAPQKAQAAQIAETARRGLTTQEILAVVGVLTFTLAVFAPHVSIFFH